MKILIVDDEFHIRKITSTILKKSGYEVIEAESGAEAIDKLLNNPEINFIITDWVMPNINGLELCKKIRAIFNERYIYIILLTAKNEKEELVQGMEAGSDDFIVKPFNVEELRVRVRAGERILKLEEELIERNKKIEIAYEQISTDLKYAHKLQTSLLPNKSNNLSFNKNNFKINNVFFDWLYIPSSFLSGDTFNIFKIDDEHIAFYHLDVSGHGIPSSVLSASLNRLLLPSQNSFIKKSIENPPFYKIESISKLLENLNNYFLENNEDGNYFTIAYFMVNVKTGKTNYSIAGHTRPIILRSEGKIEVLEDNGYPIGLIEDAVYTEHEVYLNSNDKVFLYSDGITECQNSLEEMFSEHRLLNILSSTQNNNLKSSINTLKNNILNWNGSESFSDDISALAVSF